MPSATRQGDVCTGHGSFPPRPIASGSPDVNTNGKPQVRVGDAMLPHASPSPSPPHGGALAAGSSTVNVNGKPACRIGDPITCGSAVAQGSPNVNIGDLSAGGSGGGGAASIVGGGTVLENQNSLDNVNKVAKELGLDIVADEYETSPAAPIENYPPPAPTPPNPIAETPIDQDLTPPPDKVTPVTDCSLITIPVDYYFELSTNFKLCNLTTKCTFPHTLKDQRGLTVAQIACNLKALAEHVLEPLWDQYPGFTLNSGFRTQQNGTSQHETGQACDLQWPGISNDEYWLRAQWVRDNLPYDQFIFEHGRSIWFHLSFNQAGNRPASEPRKVLTMYRQQYSPGLQRHYA